VRDALVGAIIRAVEDHDGVYVVVVVSVVAIVVWDGICQ